MTDNSIHARLTRGEVVAVGNQLWQRCGLCEEPVRLNKPFVGSFHLCLTPEEIAAKRRQAQTEMQARMFEKAMAQVQRPFTP